MWFLSLNKNKEIGIIYSAYSDKGRRDGENQDAYFVFRSENFSLFCIADGMGGHSKGEVASGEITKAIEKWLKGLYEKKMLLSQMIFDEFEKVVDSINLKIYKEYNQASICGATIVALLIKNGEYCVISAGDSRAYKVEKGKIIQITRDDVWINESGDERFNADNGKLTKAVGIAESLICNRVTGSIDNGTVFFLCTDGVYKVIAEKELNKIVRTTRKSKHDAQMDAVLEMIKQNVLCKGAPDNNTGILVKCIYGG
ncbi:PP2C family protein-serine/threonine phosphatase [Butyrivibrio sp. YAB3001]|uniref:PP2C family protein-serine/threonine phosphatase n=1 Tax=Butyrivibrio sp. YAB3001 TaxID=1520812 RepID=UPI0008F62281|nr:PP2C family serine/threonine-protein phosphatase [Butyrivibrio sp. YAB3001]SFB82331.1 Serine/threonine protein phosphatase PrpC [Butyrivibrio sp. YAB3001]